MQVERARQIAETLLADSLPRRWAHTQGVAAAARRLAPILGDDAELLEAAAWLHDIGYAPDIAHLGFHPLDGARYLRDFENADPRVCALVAYHTGGLQGARECGLGDTLGGEFTAPPEFLLDAITYCDLTTSPDGNEIDAEERVADIVRRYGAEHPVGKGALSSSRSWFASVRRIEAHLAS
ncbi:HD domain-containing protein [Pseudonocardia hierapolitana]|uniref:HD domain-containing protein n=1 Tax=Pseudonocardia hierapolitana TaxID=1128676 RepID=A0A561SYU5_9PSEU|nr:HD domain-containing protein [Pseudonocardia hierapolitana]TWF80040.1 HD domain-containing protein [Pseudonocardia hierapolitana]